MLAALRPTPRIDAPSRVVPVVRLLVICAVFSLVIYWPAMISRAARLNSQPLTVSLHGASNSALPLEPSLSLRNTSRLMAASNVVATVCSRSSVGFVDGTRRFNLHGSTDLGSIPANQTIVVSLDRIFAAASLNPSQEIQDLDLHFVISYHTMLGSTSIRKDFVQVSAGQNRGMLEDVSGEALTSQATCEN